MPRRPQTLVTTALLTLLCLAAACASQAPPASSPPASSPASVPQPAAHPVESILSRMTLEEKVGQMTQPELMSIEPEEVTELHIGSVLSGGNSDPAAGNSMQAWTDTYDRYQRAALESRLGIPILYGVDAVHGHSNVLDAVIFPHNIGLGATRNPGLVRRIAEITGKEMLATGVQWTFSPALSVPRDERWGRTYEGFSEDPELVSELGAAAVLGYQRGDLGHPLAVLATAKHYLGDGGTLAGTGTFGDSTGLDQGDMLLSEEEVRRVHLYPYRAAVDAGVGSIMPSYSSWNGEKLSGHGGAVTYSEDGAGAAGADVIVAVVGETPYAEGIGDRMDLSLDPDHKAMVERLAGTGIPVVVVLISGRPLIIDETLTTADAFVAAWLPGTEGAGVADVLFGDHAPTGRLSFTWPRSMSQLPMNVGDEEYDPLFPFGYGLTY